MTDTLESRAVVVAGCFAIACVITVGASGCRHSSEESSSQMAEIESGPGNEHQRQIEELQEKIDEWTTKRGLLRGVLADLRNGREQLLNQLSRLGVKSPADGAVDPRARVLLDELRDLLNQQSLLERKYEEYDLAVFRSDSRLRTMERRIAARDAGITDRELDVLTRSMLELDDSLVAESSREMPLELDESLTRAMELFASRQAERVKKVVIPSRRAFPRTVPVSGIEAFPPRKTMPDNSLEGRFVGDYRIEWQEPGNGISGTTSYTFRRDHAVFENDRHTGSWKRENGHFVIEFAETARGRVAISLIGDDGIEGRHGWGSGRTALWRGERISADGHRAQ